VPRSAVCSPRIPPPPLPREEEARAEFITDSFLTDIVDSLREVVTLAYKKNWHRKVSGIFAKMTTCQTKNKTKIFFSCR
jgi:hypothetical protein